MQRKEITEMQTINLIPTNVFAFTEYLSEARRTLKSVQPFAESLYLYNLHPLQCIHIQIIDGIQRCSLN